MGVSFLRQIIKKNWAQEIDDHTHVKLAFTNDLLSLHDNDLHAVLRVCLESIDVELDNDAMMEKIVQAIRSGKSYQVNGTEISLDFLLKIVLCMAFSEYRIDDFLLYPREMRFRALREAAISIGLEEETVRKIDRNWHDRVRGEVFPVN